jgi:hypothetical protein
MSTSWKHFPKKREKNEAAAAEPEVPIPQISEPRFLVSDFLCHLNVLAFSCRHRQAFNIRLLDFDRNSEFTSNPIHAEENRYSPYVPALARLLR